MDGLRSRCSVGFVQRLQRLEHALAERQRLDERHRAALEALRQGLAFEQLHGDEELARVLADLVDLAHVRVVHAGGGAGFAPEALAGRVVGLRDRLHGDLAAQALVLGGEHDAHAALPEPVQDPVAAEPRRVAGPGRRGRSAQSLHQAPEEACLAAFSLGREVGRAVPGLVLAHRGFGREYTRPP